MKEIPKIFLTEPTLKYMEVIIDDLLTKVKFDEYGFFIEPYPIMVTAPIINTGEVVAYYVPKLTAASILKTFKTLKKEYPETIVSGLAVFNKTDGELFELNMEAFTKTNIYNKKIFFLQKEGSLQTYPSLSAPATMDWEIKNQFNLKNPFTTH